MIRFLAAAAHHFLDTLWPASWREDPDAHITAALARPITLVASCGCLFRLLYTDIPLAELICDHGSIVGGPYSLDSHLIVGVRR